MKVELGHLSPGKIAPFSWKVSRCILLLLVVPTVWLAGSFGALGSIEGVFYDFFLRLRSHYNPAPVKVFLLPLDDPGSLTGRGGLSRLLELLDRAGAQQVAFNFVPETGAERLYAEFDRPGNVIFGRQATRRPGHPGFYELDPLPEAVREGAPFLGAVARPPRDGGVYRRQLLAVDSEEGVVPGLESLIAHRVLGREPSSDRGTFYIDFRGGPASLPTLPASKAIAGDLIPELVHGKCVLVGPLPSRIATGLNTPTTGGQETFSMLEYQGHALNTLLAERQIRRLSSGVELVLLLVSAAVSLLAYRLLSVSAASWLTLFLVLGYVGLGVLFFVQLGLWLPVAKWTLLQASLFLVFLFRRVKQLTHTFQRLLSDAIARLREHRHSGRLEEELPSWSLVAHMLDQTLDVNRLIFLEADHRHRRVKEIVALHCSFRDIQERRRTFTRRPYSDAMAAKGPVRVQNFWHSADADEEQYLTPIIFGGELLGFWALGIHAFKAASIPRFEGLLRDYTARISELLYYYTRKRFEHHPVEALLGRRLLIESTEESYQNLNTAFRLLDQRLDRLALLVDQLESGIIIYDIFGRLLQVNPRMLEHLRREGITPFHLSALDLLLAISEYDISKAKEILRKVIAEDEMSAFPVEFQTSPGTRYVLQVKPLYDRQKSAEGKPGTRQKTIVFELLDTTTVTRLNAMKTKLTERLFTQMRSDLATIDLSASIIGSVEMPDAHYRTMGDVIHGRVRDAVSTVGECQQYLCLEAGNEDFERFPVDPLPLLKGAVESVRKEVARQNITVEFVETRVVSYILASSEKLRFIFDALLDALVKDAAEETVVRVSLGQQEELVVFEFSNNGFGIPNETLQEYIRGGDEGVAEEFAHIQKAANWVESWGGIFEGSSGVGVGMRFALQLARFI